MRLKWCPETTVLRSMDDRCIHSLPLETCCLCAELEKGLPRLVFITGGGQAFHVRDDCPSLLVGQRLVDERGGRAEPIEQVSIKDAKTAGRRFCRGCAGSAPSRGRGGPADPVAVPRVEARTPTYSLEEVRRHYPRAYEPWDGAEDAYLLREFERGRTAEELSVVLGRKFGAICSRLAMLRGEMPPGPGTAVA